MLLNAYHAFLPNYSYLSGPQSRTKRTSESRAESGSTAYTSILRVNSKSPLSKLNLSEDNRTYSLQIKEATLSLQNALHALSTDVPSLFRHKELISEHPDAVAVRFTEDEALPVLSEEDAAATLTPNARSSELSFSVYPLRLAKNQQNTGTPRPAAAHTLPAGNYKFQISFEEKSYAFQFPIGESATNETALTNLARFINQTKIGLDATLETTGADSSLTLTSAVSGTSDGNPVFTLEDLSYPEAAPAGLVDYYGLSQMRQAPQNALFLLNGQEKESLGNHFTLNKTISVDLLAQTDAPVSVRTVTKSDKAVEAVQTLVDRYNDLYRLASEHYPENHRSHLLMHQLKSVVQRHFIELAEIGITDTEDGSLTIDTDALTQAAEGGQLESVFRRGSFSVALDGQLEDISLNPTDFLDKTVICYRDTRASIPTSPYHTSLYSGMLFSLTC